MMARKLLLYTHEKNEYQQKKGLIIVVSIQERKKETRDDVYNVLFGWTVVLFK